MRHHECTCYNYYITLLHPEKYAQIYLRPSAYFILIVLGTHDCGYYAGITLCIIVITIMGSH